MPTQHVTEPDWQLPSLLASLSLGKVYALPAQDAKKGDGEVEPKDPSFVGFEQAPMSLTSCSPSWPHVFIDHKSSLQPDKKVLSLQWQMIGTVYPLLFWFGQPLISSGDGGGKMPSLHIRNVNVKHVVTAPVGQARLNERGEAVALERIGGFAQGHVTRPVLRHHDCRRCTGIQSARERISTSDQGGVSSIAYNGGAESLRHAIDDRDGRLRQVPLVGKGSRGDLCIRDRSHQGSGRKEGKEHCMHFAEKRKEIKGKEEKGEAKKRNDRRELFVKNESKRIILRIWANEFRE